jgi:hypothetical protein
LKGEVNQVTLHYVNEYSIDEAKNHITEFKEEQFVYIL